MGHIVNNGDVAVVEGFGKCLLENGSGSHDPPKFKKRRVSAVRDFPEGCGRFVAVNRNCGVVGLVEEVTRKRDLVVELEEPSSVNQSIELKTLDMAVGLVQKELPKSPKFSSSIHETVMPLENLDQAEDLDPMKNLEHIIVEALPLQSIPSDKVVERIDNLQTLVTVGALPESMRKKYPPRRSISACRDFPPGCGRDAAPINSKEILELVKPSKGKSLVNKMKDKIVETVPKPLGQEVEVGDASKSKMKVKSTKKIGEGSQVMAGSQIGEVKDFVEQNRAKNLSKSASNQPNTDETIIKAPRQSLMSQSDSRSPSFSKKVGKGSERSEEKLGMESVKLDKDLFSHRKLPGKSINDSCIVNQTQGREYVGLDASQERVIVQSLMAEPNCPWSQAKKTSQPATGNQSQVGQGKKTLKSASGKQSQAEQGKKTFKCASANESQLQVVKYGNSQSSDREIVQSLMAAPYCPWRQGSKGPSKGKKQAFVRK